MDPRSLGGAAPFLRIEHDPRPSCRASASSRRPDSCRRRPRASADAQRSADHRSSPWPATSLGTTARARSVYASGKTSANPKLPSGADHRRRKPSNGIPGKADLSACHQADLDAGRHCSRRRQHNCSVDMRRRHHLQCEIDSAPLLAFADREHGRLCGRGGPGIERGGERDRLRWRRRRAAMARASRTSRSVVSRSSLPLRTEKPRPPRRARRCSRQAAGHRYGTRPGRRLSQTLARSTTRRSPFRIA